MLLCNVIRKDRRYLLQHQGRQGDINNIQIQGVLSTCRKNAENSQQTAKSHEKQKGHRRARKEKTVFAFGLIIAIKAQKNSGLSRSSWQNQP
jgi:hypothetical protein